MDFIFDGEIIEWRGPAPFFFVAVPEDVAREIADLSAQLSYGWGVIPAAVTVGQTTVSTSLFPRNHGYLVPIKNALWIPENLSLGQTVRLSLRFEV